jgi:hypothetical protein
MRRAIGVGAGLLLLALVLVWWRTGRTPQPAASKTAGPAAAPAPARPFLGSCDQQPALPKLPDSVSPASDDMADIVRALDAALNDQHKAWLRCFTLDDELLARTHFGFGRWLRTTLRLRTRPALAGAIGTSSPDEMSSVITLIYVAHLRGQTLSLADAKARRAAALAEGGVTR